MGAPLLGVAPVIGRIRYVCIKHIVLVIPKEELARLKLIKCEFKSPVRIYHGTRNDQQSLKVSHVSIPKTLFSCVLTEFSIFFNYMYKIQLSNHNYLDLLF